MRSQRRLKPGRSRRKQSTYLLALSAATPLLGGASLALGVDRTWLVNGNGTFQTAANWSGGVVPGASDVAIIDATGSNNSAYTISFTGTVVNDHLRADDNVTLNLNGNSYFLQNSLGGMFIGIDAAEARTTTLANGTFNVASNVTVGSISGSTAGLIVGSTATLVLPTGFTSVRIGTASSVGTMSVSGTVSATTMLVGSVTAPAPSTATFAAGSSGTFPNNVRISNGAIQLNGGALSTGSLGVGEESQGTGTLRINGGMLDVAGILSVSALSGSSGTVILSSGTINSGSVGLGRFTSNFVPSSGLMLVGGSTAPARVNNAATLSIGHALGADSGNGTLVIDGSAARVDTGTVVLGGSAGAGTLVMRNASRLNVTGGIHVGTAGFGMMEVTSGADVTATASINLASAQNATALTTLRGNGTTFVAIGQPIRVGNGGTATLIVEDGALLTTGPGTIGAATGGVGTVSVRGTNSLWSSSGSITLPGDADASAFLEIGAGATVATGVTGTLAINPGGTVVIDGGTLRAGAVSIATTTFSGGGKLQFNSGTLHLTTSLLNLGAFQSVSMGPQFLLDANKALVVDGELSVGVTGTVLAMRGGVLRVNGVTGTVIGPGARLLLQDPASAVTSRIVVDGGLVSGSGLISGNYLGTAAIGSELRVGLGEEMSFYGSVADNSGLINLLGGALSFNASVNNAASGRITGRGILRTGGLNNSGSVLLSAGLSDVFGGLTNQTGGKTIVTGNAVATFYDPVTNNPGSEFRVSPGSTAVFFGNVAGLSQFTGSGTTIFEGPASFGRIGKTGATRVGSFGDLTAEHIRDGRLDIEGSAAIAPDGTDAGTSRVGVLAIDAGGRLDLSNNAMVIDYDGASPLNAVRAHVASGFAGGAWNGDGISSSSAATTPNRAIGIAEGFDIGSPALFAGQPADATSVMLHFTLPGDANLDRVVNIADFSMLGASFNHSAYWARGDFNYDGTAGIADFSLLAANFNQALPADRPPALAVPDPGLAGLALVGAVARRRRSAVRPFAHLRSRG